MLNQNWQSYRTDSPPLSNGYEGVGEAEKTRDERVKIETDSDTRGRFQNHETEI